MDLVVIGWVVMMYDIDHDKKQRMGGVSLVGAATDILEESDS